MMKNEKSSGFVFLEILIAIALISTVFIALLNIGFFAMSVSYALEQQTKADSLMKEEFEALRSFRNSTEWEATGLGAVNYGPLNPYYMLLNTGTNPATWTLSPGTETAGIFTRHIIFDQVSRDPSTKNIEAAYNASNDDPDTIKATITVFWLGKTWQVASYLTNWNK